MPLTTTDADYIRAVERRMTEELKTIPEATSFRVVGVNYFTRASERVVTIMVEAKEVKP